MESLVVVSVVGEYNQDRLVLIGASAMDVTTLEEINIFSCEIDQLVKPWQNEETRWMEIHIKVRGIPFVDGMDLFSKWFQNIRPRVIGVCCRSKKDQLVFGPVLTTRVRQTHSIESLWDKICEFYWEPEMPRLNRHPRFIAKAICKAFIEMIAERKRKRSIEQRKKDRGINKRQNLLADRK